MMELSCQDLIVSKEVEPHKRRNSQRDRLRCPGKNMRLSVDPLPPPANPERGARPSEVGSQLLHAASEGSFHSELHVAER